MVIKVTGDTNNTILPTEFGERERERQIGAALVRESLREREQHAASVVEATTTGATLLELHGLGAGGQRRRFSQRRSDRHEQHGSIAGAAARLLFVRMTTAGRRRRRTAPAPSPVPRPGAARRRRANRTHIKRSCRLTMHLARDHA